MLRIGMHIHLLIICVVNIMRRCSVKKKCFFQGMGNFDQVYFVPNKDAIDHLVFLSHTFLPVYEPKAPVAADVARANELVWIEVIPLPGSCGRNGWHVLRRWNDVWEERKNIKISNLHKRFK